MRFSQRYGYTPVKDVIQLESMDSDLRNSLWNALEIHYWIPLVDRKSGVQYLSLSGNGDIRRICEALWVDFFKDPLDSLPNRWSQAKDVIRHFFFTADWYEVYDFIEFIATIDSYALEVDQFGHDVNLYLEREASGYRFVDRKITPITDLTEINEIETAVAGGSRPVSEHLNTALAMLSDRQNPDYRNSIKESISAVEGQVRSHLGTESGTLGALLNQLERREPLHPALKQAFSQLYGYTADESGIRHALLDGGREIPFEEAKFMLVACSAFINYVRGVTKS